MGGLEEEGEAGGGVAQVHGRDLWADFKIRGHQHTDDACKKGQPAVRKYVRKNSGLYHPKLIRSVMAILADVLLARRRERRRLRLRRLARRFRRE